MKKTLLILTSLIFLVGCQASSHNTGNITNGGSSAESVQDSENTNKHPKGTQRNGHHPLSATTSTVAHVALIALLGVTVIYTVALLFPTE